MEYKRIENTVFLRLAPGEDVVGSVLKLAEEENIGLAEVNGLGAIRELEVGVYNTTEKKYYKNHFEGAFEISSLHGTLTTREGDHYLHLHINCGGMDGSVIGGHLNKAIVSATAEIVVRCVDGEINRKWNEDIGLFLFDF